MKIGFFEEQEGQKSYMRMAGFIVLMLLVGVHILHEIKHFKNEVGYLSDNYLYFVCILLGFAFFPKVMQKIIEMFLQVKMGALADPEKKTVTTTKVEQKVEENK